MTKLNQVKIKSGLTRVTSGIVDFYLIITGVPYEEFAKRQKYIDLSFKKKNKHGTKLRAKVHIFNHESIKVGTKLNPFKSKSMLLYENDKDSFTVRFNHKINIREKLKLDDDTYAVKFTTSKTSFYYLQVDYQCTKKVINSMNNQYYRQSAKKSPRNEIVEGMKKKSGIEKKTKLGVKVCGNCYYFSSGKCGYHKLRVNKKESCAKFYSPRINIVQGGKFSSK